MTEQQSLLLLTTKECVKKVHGLTLVFGVVAIMILSIKIEMGLILLPDLEAYMNECSSYEFL